jgi:serine/threonine-protein kinase
VTADFDRLLESLAERIAEGETIDPAGFPPGFVDDPRARALLRFARVAGTLVANAGGEASAPTVTAAPGGADRIGPWRLVRLLGSGGMGDVWLGERSDGTVEHRVAIKRVRGGAPAFAARLEAERRILARLSHPHIARFVDAGLDAQGAPWLALDFVEGENLADWCTRTRPGLRARLDLFRKVCAAVEHAHRLLVVHRDLKPGNVMVDAAGEPRLLDFGIAKLLGEGDGTLTASSLTPAYAAPEQLRGGEVSTATDVYALGLLLYRLLADALPETRRDPSVAAVLSRLDDEETRQPSATARTAPGLPYAADALEGDLDAIVSKAIRAAPEQRYGSVAELSADVQRYLEDRPVKARPPTRAYLANRFVRRHRGALTITALAVLGILASLGVALWQARVAERNAQLKAAEAERADRAAAVAQAQARRARRSAEFAFSVFEQADVLRRDDRGVISIDEAFEDSLARIDREFSDDPMVAADLNDDFGELLASKGRFDEADARLRKALALAEQAHGAHSPVVAETLINLAAVASYRGRALEGKPWIERAVAILRPLAGSEPDNLGNALMSLANVRLQEGRHDEALALMERAVAVYDAMGRVNDPRIGIAEFNLGATLYSAGRWADAQPHFDRALEVTAGANGADSPGLLPLLDFVMSNLDNLGRHGDAEAAARRMLSLAQANFDGVHPLTASALIEAGHHRMQAGEVDAGLAMIERGILMLASLETPLELFGWRAMLKGLAAQQRWPEVATRALQAVARCVALKQAASSRCAEIDAYAAQARAAGGDAAGALAAANAVLARLAADQLGGEAPAQARLARAMALQASGDADAARREREAALAALRTRYVDSHRDVRRLTAMLASPD